MAADGSEPTKNSNLKAVADRLRDELTKATSREVLYAGMGESRVTIPLGEGEAYESLEIHMGFDGDGLQAASITVPFEDGTYSVRVNGDTSLQITFEAGEGFYVYLRDSSSFVSRVIGIRSGGGSSLIDLLRYLGEVA